MAMDGAALGSVFTHPVPPSYPPPAQQEHEHEQEHEQEQEQEQERPAME